MNKTPKTSALEPYLRKYATDTLNLMREGAALPEVAAYLEVDMQTIIFWRGKHISFEKAVRKGEALAEAWWYKQGREGLYDKNFKATLWVTYMKYHFGWGEKIEESSFEQNIIQLHWLDSVS